MAHLRVLTELIEHLEFKQKPELASDLREWVPTVAIQLIGVSKKELEFRREVLASCDLRDETASDHLAVCAAILRFSGNGPNIDHPRTAALFEMIKLDHFPTPRRAGQGTEVDDYQDLFESPQFQEFLQQRGLNLKQWWGETNIHRRQSEDLCDEWRSTFQGLRWHVTWS